MKPYDEELSSKAWSMSSHGRELPHELPNDLRLTILEN